MKVLIVYRSKYGATALCAERIADTLNVECNIADLKSDNPDPAGYDVVVIGGSIYSGHIQRAVQRFCEKHRATLEDTIVGYFISCLYEDDRAREELKANFPAWLKAHAVVGEWLGGRAILNKMTRMDRYLFLKIAKVNTDISAIREDRISAFCDALSEKMNP